MISTKNVKEKAKSIKKDFKERIKSLKERIDGVEGDIGIYIPCYICGDFVCRIEDSNAPIHLKRMLKQSSTTAAFALKIINKTKQFMCQKCIDEGNKAWKPTKKEMKKLIKEVKK